jgi:HEXXH motif-containing protein
MEIFSYLSHPSVGDFRSVAAELCTIQFHAFCGRAQPLVRQGKHAPLVEQVMQGLSAQPPSLAYWTPEVSWIYAGLQGMPADGCPPADQDWLAAQVGVAAFLTGVLDRVCLRVDVLAPVLIAGRTFVGALVIDGSGDRLCVRLAGGAETTFHALAGRDGAPVWVESTLSPTQVLLVDGYPAVRLVGKDWHASRWIDQPCDDAPAEAAAAQIEAALALLRDVAPDYHDWTTCLLKEVTPIRRPAPGMIASNSSALRMGGIDLATPASATETVEMLVHECTHQYYHMCSWMGSTVVPDAKPYFSPLKQCERPLDRILLGYHAFGNAMIVFDRMAAKGMAAEIQGRWRTVSAYMDQLVTPLRDPAQLSELGVALFAPLHARLERLDHRRPPAIAAA